MKVHGVLILTIHYFSLVSFVCSSPTVGTATRFVTEKLPRFYSRSSVLPTRYSNFMPSVGNGYVSTVIYSDTVHVSGVFNGPARPKKYPIYPVYFYEHTHRARVPSTASVNFKVEPGIPGKTSYALDVGEGVFYKWFKSESLNVEQRIYAHRTRKNLLVVEITAKNNASREFELKIVPNLGYITDDISFYMTDSGRSDALAATGRVNKTEERGSLQCNVAIVWTYPDPNHPLIISNSSEEQTWYYITSIATNLDTKFNPLSEALRQWDDAMLAKEQLLKEHKSAWKALWDTGRIEIEGDLKMAQAVYGSILSSTRHDWPYGLSPGGLPAAEEYMGHTFWDQDIWMYPPLVLLHPDLARSAMRYRKDRLPAARRIAKQYGYEGAMFPWESSFTGLETSPGEKYGKNQNHITGDVALAARMFWKATKDLFWLRNIGFPLAYQTAEYWASRVEYDVRYDRYVINHVMPPDEYHYPVNNSVYTNVVAKMNLLFAKEAADILGKKVPTLWSTIAEKMYIPFDSKLRYHPEFDGYHPDVKVKQADVVLIGYPVMHEMEKQVRYNDLAYYQNLTDPNGPAMTHAMFAIGWLETGEKEKAEQAFMKNYANIQGPFKVWSERRWGHGAVNFITGAGGFLQAVIYGYGGFRIKEDGLYFNSTLPARATKLALRINYLESSIDFEVKVSGVTISLVTSGPISPQLEVITDGQGYRLTRGNSVTMETMTGVVRQHTSHLPWKSAP
ncbi:protein-glucosylgalactosylhydroxylysine glucosidase-like isoform X1 [Montipora foliosa]|uniref:protein-glucosylgalactosylhydroxylysine glucosidase-like isoform X1 n=1 Tax=Montipora foliosa TaxID=591990 RepID=UPI0035F1DBBD